LGVSKARIGDLRHRITIESLTLAGDGQGGSSETWATFATVWASVEPVKGGERFFSEQIQYQRTHKIIIRHLTGINSTMRISFDGRTFQIKAIRRADERKFFMLIDAEENQGT